MTSDDEIDIFEERESLRTIRDYARQHLAGPVAVLFLVLMRAGVWAGPRALVPGIVGTPKPLNMIIGVVGPSGLGKNVADDVAESYWPTPGVPVYPIGSGEGTTQALEPDEDGNPAQDRVIFTSSEVHTYKALGERSGSILLPTIRQIVTGDQLGQKNAHKATTRIVKKRSYAVGMSIGIQNECAGVLIDDAAGGTPQRIAWASALDLEPPENPRTGVQPWRSSTTEELDLSKPIPFPDCARDEIRAHRRRTLMGDPTIDPLDGHAYLTRCKLAAALMLIDGRNIVTEDDWRVAGRLMEMSNGTRTEIIRATEQATRRANRARALASADRDEIVSDRKAQRARETVLRKIDARGQLTKNQLRMAMKADIRDYLDAALSDLLDAREITVSPGRSGTHKVHVYHRYMPAKQGSISDDGACTKRTYVPSPLELAQHRQPRERQRTRGRYRPPSANDSEENSA